MHGDFSQLNGYGSENFTGVLHQQCRVLMDRDWNDNFQIIRHLRELLGRDTIGPDLVGVPAAQPASLQVLEADSDGTRVEIVLHPGRGWIDGLPFCLTGTAPLTLQAEYLG